MGLIFQSSLINMNVISFTVCPFVESTESICPEALRSSLPWKGECFLGEVNSGFGRNPRQKREDGDYRRERVGQFTVQSDFLFCLKLLPEDSTSIF